MAARNGSGPSGSSVSSPTARAGATPLAPCRCLHPSHSPRWAPTTSSPPADRRGALGYAWDQLLIYAAGGYAGGKIDGQYVCTATGIVVLPGPPCGAFGAGLASIDATGHTWNHGWYAGIGLALGL